MVAPLLKYPGNKRRLVETIAAKLGPITGRYLEPFAGSAAVFFHLEPKQAVIADACAPLMAFYSAIQQDPNGFYEEIQKLLALPFAEATYYQVREEWNAKDYGPKFAAQLLYMNKLGFNGLFRLSKTYKYNVAWGKKKTMPKFPEYGQIMQTADVLKGAVIGTQDYSISLAMAEPGDSIYIDSPYYGTFDRYTGQGFDSDAQFALAEQLKGLADKGVKIVASNIDCQEIRALYSWAKIESIQLYHKIGCTSGSRKMVNEALILAGV